MDVLIPDQTQKDIGRKVLKVQFQNAGEKTYSLQNHKHFLITKTKHNENHRRVRGVKIDIRIT